MEKLRTWVKENILGVGTSQDFARRVDDDGAQVKVDEWIEVPDAPPDPPREGESASQYAGEFLWSFLQGLGISAIINVLKHILEKEDKPEK